jgi:hypothetical protein
VVDSFLDEFDVFCYDIDDDPNEITPTLSPTIQSLDDALSIALVDEGL